MEIIENVEQAWELYPLGVPRRPKMTHILAAVVLFTGISATDILSERKTHPILRARYLFVHVARTETLNSYPQIARFIRRDHTTLLNSVARVKKALDEGDEGWARDIAAVTALANELASRRRAA